MPILPSVLTVLSALLPAPAGPATPTPTPAPDAAPGAPATPHGADAPELVFFAAGVELTSHDELGVGGATVYGQFGRRLGADVWLTLRAGGGISGGFVGDSASYIDLQLGAAYHRCAERWLCGDAGVGVGHRRGSSTDDEQIVTDVRGVTASARAGVELRVAGPLALRFDGHVTGVSSYGDTESGVGYGFDAATVLRF